MASISRGRVSFFLLVASQVVWESVSCRVDEQGCHGSCILALQTRASEPRYRRRLPRNRNWRMPQPVVVPCELTKGCSLRVRPSGQRPLGFPGGGSGGEHSRRPGDVRDAGSLPGSGRSPGGGPGNPLQCSCLENSMDRGAWQARVHDVPKSQTWLKWFSM